MEIASSTPAPAQRRVETVFCAWGSIAPGALDDLLGAPLADARRRRPFPDRLLARIVASTAATRPCLSRGCVRNHIVCWKKVEEIVVRLRRQAPPRRGRQRRRDRGQRGDAAVRLDDGVEVPSESFYASHEIVDPDTGTSVAANKVTEERDETEAAATASPLRSQTLSSETPNAQIATLNTPDPAPPEAKETSVNAVDSCPLREERGSPAVGFEV
jgi:hypothetical protein